MQEQLATATEGVTQAVELPGDFETLMSITDGIGAAGVPAEANDLELVYPLDRQRPNSGSSRPRVLGETVLAYWEIGGSGCRQSFRDIYYALCQPSDTDTTAAVWKV